MSITVTMSAVQSSNGRRHADEMSYKSPFTVVEVDFSAGDDHCCCRKPHWSLRSFTLTGTVFYSILSHFARIQSSRLQYFTSTNHLLCDFYLHFLLKACFKSPPAYHRADWSTAVASHRHTPRLIVMHVVFRYLLTLFRYAAKQVCKQLQCIKAKLSQLASINGLHNIRVYVRASLLSVYTNENRGGHIYTAASSWGPHIRFKTFIT